MTTSTLVNDVQPFANCAALDGCHCWSNSIAKIYDHYGLSLSEELLFGLGAGLGFMYWEQKGSPPFIGGRGNINDFMTDIGRRTGVRITERSTTSTKKAQNMLLAQMSKEEPLMIRVDMGFMPYFDFGGEDYHFGSHTAVVCGFDGQEQVLVSDINQSDTGVKRGFYAPVSLEQLSQARGSTYKPFPPKNTFFEFDFEGSRAPTGEDILAAVRHNSEAMLNPPISNFGVKGIRRAAKEIVRWPDRFDEVDLRANLFMFYIMSEIGGTGGGMFRLMYGRFLEEAASITGAEILGQAAGSIHESGARFSRAANLFKDVLDGGGVGDRVERAAEMLKKNADVEEETFTALLTAV